MRQNSGNALWFILLAIFLLGGLTVLLSRTGSNTEETGSTEQVSIRASEIIRYAAGVKAGIEGLRSRGCSENQISFQNTTGSRDYTNPNSPEDKSCHVFDANGAGLSFKAFPASWFSQASGHGTIGEPIFFNGINVTNVGTSAPELILHYSFIATKELCMAINRSLSIPNDANDAPSQAVTVSGSGGIFVGQYLNPSTVPIGQNPAFIGKSAGCIRRTEVASPINYQFFSVILPR